MNKWMDGLNLSDKFCESRQNQRWSINDARMNSLSMCIKPRNGIPACCWSLNRQRGFLMSYLCRINILYVVYGIKAHFSMVHGARIQCGTALIKTDERFNLILVKGLAWGWCDKRHKI